MAFLIDENLLECLDSIQAAVIVYDSSERIVAVNEEACRLLPIQRDKAVGYKIEANSRVGFYHPDGKAIPHDEHPVAVTIRDAAPLNDITIYIDIPGTEKRYWLLVSTYPILDPEGRVKYVVVTSTDISTLVAAETEARYNENRYHQLFEHAPVSLWEYDVAESDDYFQLQMKGITVDLAEYMESNPAMVQEALKKIKLIDINQKTVELYRAKDKAQILENLWDNLQPEEVETFRRGATAYLKSEPFFECETSTMTLDGQHMDILYRMTFPYRDDTCRRVLVSVVDITERKRFEEALKKSESMYRAIFEGTSDVVGIMTPDSVIKSISPSVKDVFGYEPAGAIGKCIVDFLHPDDFQTVHEVFSKLLKDPGGTAFINESRWLSHEGKWIYADANLTNLCHIQGVDGVVFNTRDVSSRREIAEERLKYISFLENMGKVDRAFHSSTDLDVSMQNALQEMLDIFRCDRVWLLFPCDPDAESWSVPIEVTKDEYPGALAADTSYPMTAEIARLCRNALERDLPFAHNLDSDITLVPISNVHGVKSEMVLALYPRTGKPWLLGLHQCSYIREWDVEEKRLFLEIGHRIGDTLGSLLFLEKIKANEEKYRTLITSTLEGYVAVDTGFVISDVNTALCEKLGYSRDDIIGHNFMDYLVSTHRDAYTGLNSITDRKHISLDAGLVKEDSAVLPVQINATSLFDNDGSYSGFFALITDLSERVQLEEERSKTSRLESLGILAGGIAHDFNNILSVILGNISLAKLGMDISDDNSELLDDAENACVQAKRLTKQLLTFSKGGAPVKECSYLQDLITESATFSTRGAKTSCSYNFPDNLWPADIDRGQFHQVLHNLFINAVQAMPDGGEICVNAENIIVRVDDVLPLKAGRYVRIDVQDAGHGIPDDQNAKIFDPYFTTKEGGSGLGLTTAFSVVRQHGGTIIVDSEIGVGSCFSIYVPASSLEPAKPIAQGTIKKLKTGKILVMDDDVMVQNTIQQILKELGNTVDLTADGSEAIRRYGEALGDGEPYDLVILDLTVPGGMGGQETMKELLERYGDVRGVVTSGYSNDPVMANYSSYGFSDIISKPFSIRDISIVLNDLLP